MAWSRRTIAVVTLTAAALLVTGGIILTALLVWAVRPRTGPPAPLPQEATPVNPLDGILAKIIPGPGGIENALPWWKELSYGRVDGEHDPAAPPGQPGCYGLAWGVTGYSKTVLVLRRKTDLSFQTGGWYVLIRTPENAGLTPEQIGQIQADWLDKTDHTGPLRVQVPE